MAHDHMDFIEGVAREDIAALREKERTYQGSWKKRGGVGCFMMLARKWDRLENMLREQANSFMEGPYDVFGAIHGQPGGEDGTPLAEVRDLRRYLLLVEAEMAARGVLRAGPPVTVELEKGPEAPPVAVAGIDGRRRLDLWSTAKLRAELQDLGRAPPAPAGEAFAADIRAELERRGYTMGGYGPRAEPNYPGTPEDGSHHEPRENVRGALGMKVGDRVVCSTPGHSYYGQSGVAMEFLQDGDAYVQLDGEQGHTMIKWNHLSKVP